MRTILADGWSLGGTPEGVSRWLVSLLREAEGAPGRLAWKVAYPAHTADPRPVAGSRVSYLPVPIPRSLARHRVWEQVALPAVRTLTPGAIYFSPSYTLPVLVPRPRAVIVHDIIYELHPEWFPRREAFFLRRLTRRAVARADLVLTVSATSRDDILRVYGVPEGRCRVVGPGVDPRFSPGDREESRRTVADALGIPAPYGLALGAILNRRNIPGVVEAACRVMDRDGGFRMAIVGVNRTDPFVDVDAVIRASGRADRFHRIERVPEGILPHLLRGASALVSLSRYEGFGLPVLEAMACGTPVVASRTGAHPEFVGGGGVLVDPERPAEAAEALLGILADGPAIAAMRDQAVAAAAGFTWGRSLAAVESLLGGL